MRWGGCFSSYYRWKEAAGLARDRRTLRCKTCSGASLMTRSDWHYRVRPDFCRQVAAAPLMCVNFESDGRKQWMKTAQGNVRTASSDEAAAWVDYCNNPKNELRACSHGLAEPCRIPFWQIGNETSYDKNGFDCETAARKTLAFAKEMRASDPSIALIGWGDSGWAKRMIEVAGSQLQYIAFHDHPGPGDKTSPLQGTEYRKDPARTWQYLMDGYKSHEAAIKIRKEETASPLRYSSWAPIESHFILPGPNRCAVLSTWAAGVAMARFLNVHSRHGDVLKIATAADFCGTRWMNNAVIIPTPPGKDKAFMMPVARVMSLFRAHVGEKAIAAPSGIPSELDVTASRTGNRVYSARRQHASHPAHRRTVRRHWPHDSSPARYSKSPPNPRLEIWSATSDAIATKQKELPATAT